MLSVRKPGRWRRHAQLVAGVVVSAVMLWLAARGVAWSDVRAALIGARYSWLVPAAALVVLGQVLRAVRWRTLFGVAPRPSPGQAFHILSIGYLASAVLPLRLGDPVRAWLADALTPAHAAEALAAVMSERVLDLLTIMTLLAVWLPVPMAALLDRQLGHGVWSDAGDLRWLTLVGVGAAYASALAFASASDIVGTRFGGGWLPTQAARFAAGFSALGRPLTAASAIGSSVAIWLLGAGAYWLVMRAFALDLGFDVAVLALGAVAVMAIVPSSPGYVGVFHYGVQLALVASSDVPAAVALSYALVLHGLTIGVILALGAFSLTVTGLSLRQLARRASEVVLG